MVLARLFVLTIQEKTCLLARDLDKVVLSKVNYPKWSRHAPHGGRVPSSASDKNKSIPCPASPCHCHPLRSKPSQAEFVRDTVSEWRSQTLVALKFKRDIDPLTFFNLHPKLQVIACDIAFFCEVNFSHHIFVSSMIRPKTNDSGVHATGRAIDFSLNEYTDRGDIKRVLSKSEIADLLIAMNLKYPRDDDFDTLKYHNAGSGYHLHAQVPA